MKFCTKTQDLLKAYNKATNDLLIELLERSGYSDTCFYKYETENLKVANQMKGQNFKRAMALTMEKQYQAIG